MIVPHKPCPWCGTVKYLEQSIARSNGVKECFAIMCTCCFATGPESDYYEDRKEGYAAAWEAWDEFGNGNQWQDYEVPE